MSNEVVTSPWERLRMLIEGGVPDTLYAEIEALGVRESARAMGRLSHEERDRILTMLPPEQAAALVEELAHAQGAALLAHLAPQEAAAILDQTPSDETADLLSQLPQTQVEAILAEMRPEYAEETRNLLQYAPECAGGLMITEYLAYPATMTAQQVVEDMRRNADDYRGYSIQYTFVVDDAGRLVGVLPLRDLLLAPSARPIGEMMIKNPLSVTDACSLDTLAIFFEEHNFLGVPVVGEEGKLLGIVRREDVRAALGDRTQQDFLKTQGIVGGEELRSMPLSLRSRRRLSWLSLNIGLNLVGATIIAINTDVLEEVIALAIFLPIISDMSGSAGNQAVAVSMRELSLGLIRTSDMVYVALKEIALGLVNGVVLAVLTSIVALVYSGNPWLGVVVGAALGLNTLFAVVLGGTIPLVMKRLKFDPALSSGLLLTTFTDLGGFFLVMTLARLFMPFLVQ